MHNNPNPEFRNKLNKTFARRIGKRLSDYNKNLLENILPKYLYSPQRLLESPKQKKFLEIGFGMGEHLFNQVSLHPDNLYVGAEVYLNGVANFLKLALTNRHCEGASLPVAIQAFLKKELDPYVALRAPLDDGGGAGAPLNDAPFLLWPNDLDMMLEDMPPQSLDGIYILFPDPWHKRKYLKKRLVNKERLEIFKAKLKPGGFIAFASDIEDYFADVKKLFMVDAQLKIINNDDQIAHDGYLITKYHQKAIKENRVARFIQVYFVPEGLVIPELGEQTL